MDSYLPKSYPSLMEGKKILYVHGFLSAGSTHTADVLRQFMPRARSWHPTSPSILQRQWPCSRRLWRANVPT